MDISKIKNIVVVGSGTMGHGIAQVFARKGFQVVVHDQSPEALEKGKAAVEQELNFLISEKAITPDAGEMTLKNLSWVTELTVAVKDADYIVEAIVEDLKVKQSLFAELDKLCSQDAILASNTSGISISAIAEATSRPDKVIGMHWWNPPYLIPVIEIIKGNLTSQETLDATKEITLKMDKKPVVVHKDIPGFLGNRMQYALMREAIFMLEEGVASAEDIDLMVKAGFGFKFPVMGPLETIDMAGFDIYQKVSSYLYKHICNSVEPHRLIEENIAKGKKGLKSGAGFYQYDQAGLPKLLQGRTRKLLALLHDMGHKV
jgi:3-hydroxybutyryl-CoA dehydrogenase